MGDSGPRPSGAMGALVVVPFPRFRDLCSFYQKTFLLYRIENSELCLGYVPFCGYPCTCTLSHSSRDGRRAPVYPLRKGTQTSSALARKTYYVCTVFRFSRIPILSQLRAPPGRFGGFWACPQGPPKMTPEGIFLVGPGLVFNAQRLQAVRGGFEPAERPPENGPGAHFLRCRGSFSAPWPFWAVSGPARGDLRK